jgi:hypothetical protein
MTKEPTSDSSLTSEDEEELNQALTQMAGSILPAKEKARGKTYARSNHRPSRKDWRKADPEPKLKKKKADVRNRTRSLSSESSDDIDKV